MKCERRLVADQEARPAGHSAAARARPGEPGATDAAGRMNTGSGPRAASAARRERAPDHALRATVRATDSYSGSRCSCRRSNAARGRGPAAVRCPRCAPTPGRRRRPRIRRRVRAACRRTASLVTAPPPRASTASPGRLEQLEHQRLLRARGRLPRPRGRRSSAIGSPSCSSSSASLSSASTPSRRRRLLRGGRLAGSHEADEDELSPASDPGPPGRLPGAAHLRHSIRLL